MQRASPGHLKATLLLPAGLAEGALDGARPGGRHRARAGGFAPGVHAVSMSVAPAETRRAWGKANTAGITCLELPFPCSSAC